MKISVVIPNYNSGRYLSRSLDSIFKQEYKDLEVIIADGFSTDNSLDVIQEYQKKYENLYLLMTRSEGQVNHINAGIRATRGDTVAWLCADDTYEMGCFAAISKCFEQPHVQWVYGKVKIIDDEEQETRGIVTTLKELLQPRYSYVALQCVCFISEPSVFMRKDFYLKIGPYDLTLPLTADYDYWLRAGRESKPVFINRHLANWRAHSGSTSVNNYEKQMLQAYQVQKKYSGRWLRPAQQAVCKFAITMYRVLEKRGETK